MANKDKSAASFSLKSIQASHLTVLLITLLALCLGFVDKGR
ncbi:hypothetical protein FBY55_1454 [Zymomonas mobilis]|nr:hypothetical protein FBY55_1454 [Zymomonas mobilis]